MKDLNQVRKQGRFTLIELMIVIAILAILMAIALPAYQDYTIRSQVSECMNLAGGARTAVAEYWTSDGDWPGSNADAGLADANEINGTYAASVTVGENGVISCQFRGEAPAHDAIRGDALTLTPTGTSAGGSVTWDCGGDVENKYLPRSCRDAGGDGDD